MGQNPLVPRRDVLLPDATELPVAAERALVAQSSFDLGLVSPEELVAWADREVEIAASCPTALLELSTAGGRPEVMSALLSELSRDADPASAHDALILMLARSLSARPPTVPEIERRARLLWTVGPPDQYAHWKQYEAAAGLADPGYTDAHEVVRGFVDGVSTASSSSR